MKRSSILKFRLSGEACGFTEEELLIAFEENFRRSGCYHQIERINQGLLLNNWIFNEEYYWYFNNNFTSFNWSSLGKIHIQLEKRPTEGDWLVNMTINRHYNILLPVFISLIYSISLSTWFNTWFFYYGLAAFHAMLLAYTAIGFRSIQRLFRQTIRYGNIYDHTVKSSYDWDSILKKKSPKGLREIASGKTLHPALVAEMAKKILEIGHAGDKKCNENKCDHPSQ